MNNLADLLLKIGVLRGGGGQNGPKVTDNICIPSIYPMRHRRRPSLPADGAAMLVSDQQCVGRYYPDLPHHVSSTPSLLLTSRDCFPITNKKPMLWCQIRKGFQYLYPSLCFLIFGIQVPVYRPLSLSLSLKLV